MNEHTQELLEQALALPEKERVALVASLVDSLEGPVEEGYESSWDAEIKKRLDDLDSGRVKAVPWAQARAMIFGDNDPETG